MVWNLLWWSGTHTHNIPWGNACAINTKVQTSLGLPWWLSGRALACQCRRLGFYPCVRKIPEKDNGSPLQYSRPGKSVGPQISFPFTRCVSTIVLQLYGTDEEEMLRERGGVGGGNPKSSPRSSLQPPRWQPRLQLRTAKWSPTKNNRKGHSNATGDRRRPPAEPRNAFKGRNKAEGWGSPRTNPPVLTHPLEGFRRKFHPRASLRSQGGRGQGNLLARRDSKNTENMSSPKA